jgi:hypothetical protein
MKALHYCIVSSLLIRSQSQGFHHYCILSSLLLRSRSQGFNQYCILSSLVLRSRSRGFQQYCILSSLILRSRLQGFHQYCILSSLLLFFFFFLLKSLFEILTFVSLEWCSFCRWTCLVLIGVGKLKKINYIVDCLSMFVVSPS